MRNRKLIPSQAYSLSDILTNPILRQNLEDRYWPKVKVLDWKSCWPWVAEAKHPFGYGRMTAGRGNYLKAHRVAYALRHGPIPEGASVLHRCDNPGCCNPHHLFLGSQTDNHTDMRQKGRNVNPPDKGRGDTHFRAKYTTEQARSIKNDPRHAKVIAAEYGISAKTVYQIRRGTARLP